MSIDPLKNNLFIPPATRASSESAGHRNDQSFAQILQAVNRNGEDADSAVQANSVLRLAQLQLLQGLFVTDDTAGQESDLLDSLNLTLFEPPSAAIGNRQGERLYREMQPTLRGDKTLARTDIEQMIDRVAEHVSLAPELIHSVVAAESDFQPQAVSQAGAQGLMQLMPATAKELGVQDSFDPQQNLLGGSKYLKQLLDKYDGDLDKALAAYNWGQGNVDRQGLENMPQETRNYLTKVKGLLAAKG